MGQRYAIATTAPTIESNVTASALEILNASSAISIESDSSTAASKIAFLSESIVITSSAVITASKIAFASSALDGEATVTAVGTEILYASTTISGLVITVTVGQEILYISPQPTGAATVLSVSAIRFSPAITEDTQQIRPLLMIDGKPLTEHNRLSQITLVDSFVENRNWSASRSRYYKTASPRKSFSISWSNLPSKRDQTVDLKFGRDKIREIASDPDVHTLKFLEIDSNGTTPYTETQYNVIVKSYNETLIRREVGDGLYLWDCSLELEEV